MKKEIKSSFKNPFFILKWVNAAIMRFVPAAMLVGMIYNALYLFVFGEEAVGEFNMYMSPLRETGMIFAIIWGFLYAFCKPSVLNIAYIFRGKNVMGRSIAGRVIMLFIYGSALQSTYFSFRVIALFCFVETLINMLILIKSKNMPYNEALEKMCFSEK